MARKQQSKPTSAPPGSGLLNIAAAQRRPGQSPVATIRGKAAASEFQKMQRQAAKPGGKTTGPAATAMFNAMQRQAKQQQAAKKSGR